MNDKPHGSSLTRAGIGIAIESPAYVPNRQVQRLTGQPRQTYRKPGIRGVVASNPATVAQG